MQHGRRMETPIDIYCKRCLRHHKKAEVHQSVKGQRYYLLAGPHMTTHKSFDEAKERLNDYARTG